MHIGAESKLAQATSVLSISKQSNKNQGWDFVVDPDILQKKYIHVDDTLISPGTVAPMSLTAFYPDAFMIGGFLSSDDVLRSTEVPHETTWYVPPNSSILTFMQIWPDIPFSDPAAGYKIAEQKMFFGRWKYTNYPSLGEGISFLKGPLKGKLHIYNYNGLVMPAFEPATLMSWMRMQKYFPQPIK